MTSDLVGFINYDVHNKYNIKVINKNIASLTAVLVKANIMKVVNWQELRISTLYIQ